MKIQYTVTIESANYWERKKNGVILVEKQEHIPTVAKWLIQQDIDWEFYQKLIKVRPDDMIDESNVIYLCDYTGKSAIYDIPLFVSEMEKLGIDIFIYQADIIN